MTDYLRSIDELPRLVRDRYKQLNRVRTALRSELGRPPTAEEIAERLGVSDAELARIMRDADIARVTSLDQPLVTADAGNEAEVIDVIEDRKAVDPRAAAQRQSLKELITGHLPRRERLVLLLYYYENMTMKEVGKTLGISESRVSQMRTLLLAQLRAKLTDRAPELAAAG
jgi:RNA polymerase sigma factor for flagellar operon FliA